MAVSCGDGWFCNYNFQSELDWTFSRPTEFKIISPHCRLGAHTVLIHAALAATALLRPLWNALKITMQRILFKPGKVQQRVAACKLTLRHPRRPWSEQREWTTQVEKFFYSEVFIILPFCAGNLSKWARLLFMRAFQLMWMTLRCWNLVSLC